MDKYAGLTTMTQVLSAYVDEKESGRPTYGVGKFYPSSVGKCPRAIVQQMLGYPKKGFGIQTYLILENGTYCHERLEKMFKDAGLLVASELPLKNDELLMSGRLDLIVHNIQDHPEDDELICLKNKGSIIYRGSPNDVIIVELKSIKDSGFQRLGGKPKQEHSDQVMLYMHETGIKKGIVFYENKNTQELAEFAVDYNEADATRILDKIRYCGACYKNKTLPEKPFEKHDFDCLFCDYRENCWPSDHTYNIDDVL
jgi:CRISPR/Cas system-associated exonuclease Cas4 (RecB family)